MATLPEEKITVSVIIPSYKPDFGEITGCLDGIVRSKFRPLEVILVDDGSLMEYPEDIRRRCRIIKNEKNRGAGFARNTGAREAGGNILFFVDADVRIEELTLTKIVDRFRDGNITAIQTVYSESTGVKNFLSQYQNLYQHYNFMNIRQEYICTISSYAVAIRRDAFFEVGGFVEFLRRASVEDELLGIALYRRGYPILLAKDIRVEHLACFDIGKLTGRMFSMGSDIVEYLCGHKKLQKIGFSKTYHNVNLIASILLSPSIPVFAAFSATRPLAAFIMLAFILTNAAFFIFLYRRKGFLFMLKSAAVYYLICLSAFLSCSKGSVNYLSHRGVTPAPEMR